MARAMDVMRRWWSGEESHSPQAASNIAAGTAEAGPVRWRPVHAAAGIPPALVYSSTTLSRILDQTAERFGEAVALVYGQREWTYRQLLADVNRIAGGLGRLGVRRRDRVVLALPNSPEFVASFFAIQKLGAVAMNLGPLIGEDDVARAIAVATPQVAIGLDLRAPALAQASRNSSSIQHWVWSSLESYQGPWDRLGYRVKRWCGGNGFSGKAAHISLAELMAKSPARPPALSPEADDVALLQPTGGTTGGLKLAELSHRNLLSNVMQVDACMHARTGQERILAVLPMFHAYGLTLCLLGGVFAGARIILMTRFDAQRTLETIRAQSPTIFPLVPAICEALCDEVEASGAQDRPLKGVRLCLSGAAPLPAQTAERFARLTGAEAMEGYGLTEASPVTHANFPGANHVGTIGVPLPDTLARVARVDDETKEADIGEEGELQVSGPQVMRGYFGDPDQNRGVLMTDESGRRWLKTGDIATMDEQGYFRIVDRRKDMIIRSGMKVYPSRVEQVLMRHAAVKDAAVFGRPDPMHSEQVVAAVVTWESPRQPEKLKRELEAMCREHLSAYEIPAIEFVDELPRTALGKLLRRELRQRPAPAETPTKPEESGPEVEAA